MFNNKKEKAGNKNNIFVRIVNELLVSIVVAAVLLVLFLGSIQVVGFFRPVKVNPVENECKGYNVIADIFSDIESLQGVTNSLQEVLNKGTDVSPNNSLINEIKSQVDALNESVNNITETVNISPEEALTAKLLKNEQGALGVRISNLESETISLERRIDTVYTLLVTLVLALLGVKSVTIILDKRKKP